MTTGASKRLTFDLPYESAPTWSPDGQWIAYEGYANGNLDIYLMKADGTEGPYPVTRSTGADFAPHWTTAQQGRTIAYVSVRSGNQDIYLISLDDPNEDRAINLTNTSDLQEQSPAWSPDGTQVAYTAVESGISLLYVRSVTDLTAPPKIVGQGMFPSWSPDGQSLAYLNNRSLPSQVTGDLLLISQATNNNAPAEAIALPSIAGSLSWTDASLPASQGSLAFAATSPLPQPYQEPLIAPIEDGTQVRMINLSSIVAESPNLSDRVDGSFAMLRDGTNRAAGWDFLGRLDSVWWPLNRPVEPGQDPNNWHKAGRAFDIIQTYNQGNPPQIELVRENIGADTFWRLFIRSAVQDGSLGEPLHALPWDFMSRTSGDLHAYENGGRPKAEIPSGYYVDFTRLAASYGWTPTASDITWKYNWPGISYWQYEKRDNLDWWAAMLELYPQDALEVAMSTPTAAPTTRVATATPEIQSTPQIGSTVTAPLTPTPTATPGLQGN
jgi:TolB protein